MILQTPIEIRKLPLLSIKSKILLLGSCFADEMVARMQARGLQVSSNPFGTLYNPMSIAACINRLIAGKPFSTVDLIYHDGLWHSMLHHGVFSYPTTEETLAAINAAYQQGCRALAEADVVIITFGSAWVYEQNGQVVANCHKLPATTFRKRKVAVEEIVETWSPLLKEGVLRDKTVLFTVSPIRHKADGLHENQLSKATLLLAVEALGRPYFPAYEIMMDELRDYRFYDTDMCHPTEQAVDYIWERLEESYFSKEDREELQRILAARKALNHKPLHPATADYKSFRAKAEEQWKVLASKYPWLGATYPGDGK